MVKEKARMVMAVRAGWTIPVNPAAGPLPAIPVSRPAASPGSAKKIPRSGEPRSVKEGETYNC